MTRDMVRAEQVLNSVNNEGGDHCVDFFRRVDGSFGYREFRRDPEDQGRWSLTAAHDHAIFAAYADARDAAVGQVAWLAVAVSRAAPFVP